MRNNDNGLAQFFPEPEEERMNLFLGAGIQVAGGFIGKQNGGGIYQGAGNGHALLLAAGEFRRLVLQSFCQAHRTQEFFCLFTGLTGFFAANQGGNHHVLQRRKFRQQVVRLEHEANFTVAEGR